jgi:hypothetical protein
MSDHEEQKLFWGVAGAATLAVASALLAGCVAAPSAPVVRTGAVVQSTNDRVAALILSAGKINPDASALSKFAVDMDPTAELLGQSKYLAQAQA